MRTKLFFIAAICFFVVSNTQANNNPNKSEDKPAIKKAHFNDGTSSFQEYVKMNLIYPSCAREKALEGKVDVSFFVLPDGTIHGARVTRGMDKVCDKVALNMINNMPNWNPAQKNGKPMASKVKVSINFRLDG